MIERMCDWTEQEIIDCLLERKPQDAQSRLRLQQHCRTCPSCRETAWQWIKLLENREALTMSISPPPGLKANMRMSFLRHRAKFSLRRYRRMMLTTASAMVFAGLVLFMLNPFHHAGTDRSMVLSGMPSEPAGVYRQEALMTHMDFLMQPETYHYSVIANSPSMVTGTIWLNDSSNEMLMMFDGLQPSDGRDYQAWLMAENMRINGGLLMWIDGRAHLYLKGKPFGAVRNISVSVEPKGGSMTPSGPKALEVDLPNKN